MNAMERLAVDAHDALPRVQWTERIEPDTGYEARFFLGTVTLGRGEPLSYVLSSFSLVSQGYPEGARGADGCVRQGSLVLRLSRAFALECETAARAYIERIKS